MSGVRIFQIYYSEGTRASGDKGFEGLDNLANPRPDWREYWPIRNFLLGNAIEDAAFYGFFSPKFADKTGLDAAAVRNFVEQHGDADVLLFSPFFDQMAYPRNIFDQGNWQHPGTMDTFKECARLAEPTVDFDSLVMDSSNTVFCNYFVAKGAFWREWLERCERIFRIAEEGTSDLARRLNEATRHDEGGVPTKVFVIERVASLMLSVKGRWNARARNPLSLPWSTSPIARFPMEMAVLDALKVAYSAQGHPEYLAAFAQLRQAIDRQLR
ncbi:hypothetical protein DSM104443_00760 [Usitatibacter rugosus]|uniref:Uncharacterized protein n=1 Tax=Usitatibacter rugosus TaxID=2732067 RepID=A0A6M4GQT1_9PROT|nr:hypothetical protein [Usitatibacter rugosus]QJR09710.1 hypothetical protein DSM104443_00760 [Usitatibacter rugosus]